MLARTDGLLRGHGQDEGGDEVGRIVGAVVPVPAMGQDQGLSGVLFPSTIIPGDSARQAGVGQPVCCMPHAGESLGLVQELTQRAAARSQKR